jgi:hypothetical protein
MRKQEEMGASRLLLFIKSFNVLATRVQKQEELKWEFEGQLPSFPPFFFFLR